jgi:predicted double-glycine peptidase
LFLACQQAGAVFRFYFMKIITDKITIDELNQMSAAMFGNMVKAVVDVECGLIAVDAELHSDLEALLLENGSNQKNLWGINFYPQLQSDDFVEFDSMINIRPSQGNQSRGVENKTMREKILGVIAKKVKR